MLVCCWLRHTSTIRIRFLRHYSHPEFADPELSLFILSCSCVETVGLLFLFVQCVHKPHQVFLALQEVEREGASKDGEVVVMSDRGAAQGPGLRSRNL